jgi:hypothetical protein
VQPEKPAPPVEVASVPKPKTPAPVPPAPVEPKAPEKSPEPVPPEPETPLETGRRLLADAASNYDAFTGGQRDPALLGNAEQSLRASIAALEKAQEAQADDPQVERLAKMADRLAHNIQISRMMAEQMGITRPGKDTGGSSPATERPKTPERELQLARNWRPSLTGGKKYIVDDLREILELTEAVPTASSFFGIAIPAVEQEPPIEEEKEEPVSNVLYKDITYLMPLDEAARRLRMRPMARNLITTPGLPSNSLYFYRLSGSTSTPGEYILLITDLAKQVVGVQITMDQPRNQTELKPRSFSTKRRTYDFIQGRTTSGRNWRIGYDVVRGSGIFELIAEAVIEPAGTLRNSSHLYLHRDIVDLLRKSLD